MDDLSPWNIAFNYRQETPVVTTHSPKLKWWDRHSPVRELEKKQTSRKIRKKYYTPNPRRRLTMMSKSLLLELPDEYTNEKHQ